MLPLRRPLLATALGIFGAIGACSESSSPTTPSTADAGGDATIEEASASDAPADGGVCVLPASFGSPKCNECMQENCCSQIEACSADPACKVLMLCVQGCADEPDAGGCTRTCEAEHPDQGGKWEAVVKCQILPPCAVHCLSTGF